MCAPSHSIPLFVNRHRHHLQGTATISSRTISTPNFPQNKSDILHRRFRTFLGIPTITLSYTSSNHRATSAVEAGVPVVVSSGTAIAGESNEATTTATVFGDSASTTSTTPSVEAELVPSQIPNSKMSGKSYGGREGMELGVRLGLLFLTFLTATMLVGMII